MELAFLEGTHTVYLILTVKSVKSISTVQHRMMTRLTCPWGEFNIEQVFKATVLSHVAIVGHCAGSKHQAALLLALSVVGNHCEHIKVAALPYV